MSRNLLVYRDAEALATAAADYILALAGEAQAAQGRFTLALAGGETPQRTYRRLAALSGAAGLDWSRVDLFWGDERCVAPEHPESNYGTARRSWLETVPIPPANVHRIAGELPPEVAAEQYEHSLRRFFGSAAQFDLVVLGMGADGHTASLFPSSSAIHERERWVAALRVAKLGTWRVTLTPVALNAARHILVLVTGAQKAERLRQVLTGPYEPDLLPAQVIHPAGGSLLWFVDADAAARI